MCFVCGVLCDVVGVCGCAIVVCLLSFYCALRCVLCLSVLCVLFVIYCVELCDLFFLCV